MIDHTMADLEWDRYVGGEKPDEVWRDESTITPAEQGKLLAEDMVCPYCQAPVEFCTGDRVYGSKFKHIFLYVCSRHPACDSYVGVHPNGYPKGTLADKPMREARKKAHAAFDPLWRIEKVFRTRSEAYRRLAKWLGIPQRQTHIGWFDEAMCDKVVQFAALVSVASQDPNF